MVSGGALQLGGIDGGAIQSTPAAAPATRKPDPVFRARFEPHIAQRRKKARLKNPRLYFG